VDIGDEVVILASDRLARICDFNKRGYYVQLSGSDARAFFTRADVRLAERSDILRLQSREQQQLLMPGKKDLDPIQAMLAARAQKRPVALLPSDDVVERFLRDEG
jgi:hypothetical protein